MKKIALYILAAIGLVACGDSIEGTSGSSSEENSINSSLFLEQSEIGIFSEGKMIKEFDKSSEQIVFDDDRSIYIVSNMDYTAQYTITIEGGIYLDNSLIVYLTANGLSGVEDIKASVKVLKVDSTDQRYWLWDSDLSVGLILDFSM